MPPIDDDDDDNHAFPPTNGNGDDYTVTNTLDTVDLVAEVKRVWRHVQRYERKKQTKKEHREKLRRQYSQNSGQIEEETAGKDEGRGVDDNDPDQVVANYMNQLKEKEENDEVDEDENKNPMGMMMHQFNQLHTSAQQQQRNTPSNQVRAAPRNTTSENSNSRGRSQTTFNDNGRLGKHIRSTSAHSRTHSTTNRSSHEVPNSPGGLDSTQATAVASHASTEKDVAFLNSGVDGFYEGQGDMMNNGLQQNQQQLNPARQYNRSNRVASMIQQNQQQQQRKHQQFQQQRFVDKRLLRSAVNALQHEQSNDHQKPPEPTSSAALLKPYDMTKTISMGTSFTQNTQRISNLTPNNTATPASQASSSSSLSSSALRAEMARKYMMKHRGHYHQNTNQHPPKQQQPHQQRSGVYVPQPQPEARSNQSIGMQKALQHARDTRRFHTNYNNNGNR